VTLSDIIGLKVTLNSKSHPFLANFHQKCKYHDWYFFIQD